ncbi:dipeptide ABC transporter ATP-binding protein [Yinghuangia sp. ASG 101]|uniref:dipeptide ABC transporter ATP-binding protein n=1 Tax=Yinghuangia sp. ASG 101 TaxID=2896848 RepID=UPI001E39A525|nr:ABC transporter ATP-binding protein [Yinghuangia sp. ASG 101]UGQ12405.1 dipeptide ABC transporter ATP-binding protein [Yinghuangia sp. ASG 101]
MGRVSANGGARPGTEDTPAETAPGPAPVPAPTDAEAEEPAIRDPRPSAPPPVVRNPGTPPAPAPPTATPLLTVDNLHVAFPTRGGPVAAVRGISLRLAPGECLAVVGESGSGKSVTARSLLGLAGPGAVVRADRMRFDGRDLTALRDRDWRAIRGRGIGMVLQDALVSLDPLRRVGAEVAEALRNHRIVERRDIPDRVRQLLDDARVPEPDVRARQYPHELSGGLRQRALIASAMAAGPPLLVADEPTTALDVTVQARILDLLAERKREGTAVLLISHDLAVVARLADRVAVMYGGVFVEEGRTEQVLADPAHPYTRELLAAVPRARTKGKRLSRTAGAAGAGPAAATAGSRDAGGGGCAYRPRCPVADARCAEVEPPSVPAASGAEVRCLRPEVLWPQRLSAESEPRAETSGQAEPGPPATRDRPAAGTAAGNPDGTGAAKAADTRETGESTPETAVARASGPKEVRAGAEPGGTTETAEATAARVVLEVSALRKTFPGPDGSRRTAVAGVSFRLHAGESLGVLGESGSGKTTVAQLVMGLVAPDDGDVTLMGQPWSARHERERRADRHRIQLVQQDPLSAFDPRWTVARIVGEALGAPGRVAVRRHRGRIAELLGRVGLDGSMLDRRPAQLSGGQRQRVAIARALAPEPDIIVCDEPVSALDVSIQAQILDVFADLRDALGVALLFISHDLGVIHHISDNVLVMRDGAVVERGSAHALFTSPREPYTQALLTALPMPG